MHSSGERLALAGWLQCCPDVQFGGADSCAKPPPLLYGSLHQLAHAAPLQRARRPVEKSDHSHLQGFGFPLHLPSARLVRSRG